MWIKIRFLGVYVPNVILKALHLAAETVCQVPKAWFAIENIFENLRVRILQH